MPPPQTQVPTGSSVQFRGRTKSRHERGEADTEVTVTDTTLTARPLADVESDTALDFSLDLDDITELQCDGMIRRTTTVVTDGEKYAIPTVGLDETRFRKTLVEQAELQNTCSRLSLDKFGICLCGSGTYLGCLLLVLGIGLMLTIIGAVLGAAVAGVGLLVLLVVFLGRCVSKWRGSSSWERTNGSEPMV